MCVQTRSQPMGGEAAMAKRGKQFNRPTSLEWSGQELTNWKRSTLCHIRPTTWKSRSSAMPVIVVTSGKTSASRKAPVPVQIADAQVRSASSVPGTRWADRDCLAERDTLDEPANRATKARPKQPRHQRAHRPRSPKPTRPL